MATATDPKLNILETLKRQGAMTIDQLTSQSGLSKTAMRAHLLRLEQQEMVERITLESDGRGRPPLAYRVTERGGSVFPSDDGVVLTRLLTFLRAEGATDLIRAFFEQIWAERLTALNLALDGELDTQPLSARLSALESMLTESNFMPLVESQPEHEGGTRVVVRECNCPLPAAIRATQIPCQLETRFLSKVVGAPLLRKSIASHRGEPCKFEFVVESADE